MHKGSNEKLVVSNGIILPNKNPEEVPPDGDGKTSFFYNDSDFVKHYTLNDGSESKFDRAFQHSWDAAKQKGLFRYNLDQMKTRILPGQFGFVAQLNKGRATLRRKPQEMMSVSQPFDPYKFNFTKVKPGEVCSFVLMELCHETDGKLQKDKKHMIIINVSPLEYCSVLLVPNIDDCLPQVLTKEAVQVGIEMTLLSAKRSLLVGWNSLCASASVNHLHFHAYHLDYPLRIQTEPTSQLSGPCHEILSWPVPGFVFQLNGNDVKDLASNLYAVAKYFHQKEVAHNVCLTRGTVLGSKEHSSEATLRGIIWPRSSVFGVKDVDAFNVAFSELAGHLPLMDEQLFSDLTDQSAVEALQGARLPHETFQSLRTGIQKLFVQD
ncbi:GDP-D-glucose phosphorylase 1 [Holothuria leucospilota]|uniref:GDP-D-glucose phosphorylase 1 n=1 Tax=Holothuria leucospilota TaxID=206669 RepID=A0A9Q1CHK9_HOLLE|nr:GDP-D-glucose phosphorylase 1 [Holothuria leucospilota]